MVLPQLPKHDFMNYNLIAFVQLTEEWYRSIPSEERICIPEENLFESIGYLPCSQIQQSLIVLRLRAKHCDVCWRERTCLSEFKTEHRTWFINIDTTRWTTQRKLKSRSENQSTMNIRGKRVAEPLLIDGWRVDKGAGMHALKRKDVQMWPKAAVKFRNGR